MLPSHWGGGVSTYAFWSDGNIQSYHLFCILRTVYKVLCCCQVGRVLRQPLGWASGAHSGYSSHLALLLLGLLSLIVLSPPFRKRPAPSNWAFCVLPVSPRLLLFSCLRCVALSYSQRDMFLSSYSLIRSVLLLLRTPFSLPFFLSVAVVLKLCVSGKAVGKAHPSLLPQDIASVGLAVEPGNCILTTSRELLRWMVQRPHWETGIHRRQQVVP